MTDDRDGSGDGPGKIFNFPGTRKGSADAGATPEELEESRIHGIVMNYLSDPYNYVDTDLRLLVSRSLYVLDPHYVASMLVGYAAVVLREHTLIEEEKIISLITGIAQKSIEKLG